MRLLDKAEALCYLTVWRPAGRLFLGEDESW